MAIYNDIESVKTLIEANANEISCIIIEPVAGNMGCIPPKKNFLKQLRTLCDAHNILLVFDEVMTGFRLAKGGVQELYGVNADIVCFGKVIGGGLPVGAFAARDEIMQHLAPLGSVYQGGTLSGNPLAMAAGLAMLETIAEDQELFKRLADKTEYLHKGCAKALNKHKIPHVINREGSMISIHFTIGEVVDFKTAALGNNERFKQFFHGMLAEGVYLPPSAFESYFLNDALSYEDLDATIKAVEKVASTL
jgi:glutamate-1-semialdehyde 2,1-aminomutase